MEKYTVMNIKNPIAKVLAKMGKQVVPNKKGKGAYNRRKENRKHD
mgnify:FL=1